MIEKRQLEKREREGKEEENFSLYMTYDWMGKLMMKREAKWWW